uniref:Uncharacterized protein n=1 Tax=Arundo donax TaxID=35708 RepID=A0A0A9D656_ARUDO
MASTPHAGTPAPEQCLMLSLRGCSMSTSCSSHQRSATYHAEFHFQCTHKQEAFAHVQHNILLVAQCLDALVATCSIQPQGSCLLPVMKVQHCLSS